MKLQLHRSITFWSGILVIAFLVWAWRDSLHHRSSFSWKSSGGMSCWSASNSAGVLQVGHLQQSDGERWVKVRIYRLTPWNRTPVTPESLRDAREIMAGRLFSYDKTMDWGDPRGTLEFMRHGPAPMRPLPYFASEGWRISHLAVILLSLTLWTALLLWRARRRRKQ